MEDFPMKTFHSKALSQDHPMTTGLFLLATLLTLFLLVPNMEAAAGDVPGCPHASKKSSAGCPCMQTSKGCLHALKDGLQLDEGQVKRIEEIRGRFAEDSSELRAAIREKKEELDRLFRDPNSGTDQIVAGQKALFSLKGQLGEMAMDSRLKIRGELKAEQLRGLPAGCWKKILPYGCSGKCKGRSGGHTCPYKKAPSEDPPA
jgi:Spy/CpxP family protein refolding chaperone